jgi:hypothetical protein
MKLIEKAFIKVSNTKSILNVPNSSKNIDQVKS